jgi:hypothetical protein
MSDRRASLRPRPAARLPDVSLLAIGTPPAGGPGPKRRRTRSASAEDELAGPARYAVIDKGTGALSSEPAPVAAGRAAMLLLGMRWGGREADQVRLESILQSTAGVSAIFSIDQSDEQSDFGYKSGSFSDSIPFLRQLQPAIIALDYNFLPENYFRNHSEYYCNWFSGKIHRAMAESGARVFLMPNAKIWNDTDTDVDPNAEPRVFAEELLLGKDPPGKVAPWQLRAPQPVPIFDEFGRLKGRECSTRVPSFDQYDDGLGLPGFDPFPQLSYFFISSEEAEDLHPLVFATIKAGARLRSGSSQSATKTWEINKRYVSYERAFIVFYPVYATEAETRQFLRSVTAGE